MLENEYLEPHADRRARAREPAGAADRPHRRAPAEGRPLLRRRRPDRRAGSPARIADRSSPTSPRRTARGRVRLTAVPEAGRARRRRTTRSTRWSPALDALGLPARPSTWRRGTMACTGIEFCKLAIVETKAARRRAGRPSWSSASPTSTRRSPSTSTAARTPAPAPRSPTSGSRASWSPTPTATRSRASRCTSAARSGLDAGFGRKLRGLKVTSRASCPTTSSACVRNFVEQRDDGRARSPTWALRERTRSCPAYERRRLARDRHRWRRPARTRRDDGARSTVIATVERPALASGAAAEGTIGGLGGRRRSARRLIVASHRCRTRCWSHLARPQAVPGVDVVFLDTGYHFAETIGTRDAVERCYGVTSSTRTPRQTRRRAGRRVRHGPVRPRPGPVLRAAQGRAAATGRSRATTPGSPACAATRRRPGRTRPLVGWDDEARHGEDQPARRVDRRRHARPTSTSTTSW